MSAKGHIKLLTKPSASREASRVDPTGEDIVMAVILENTTQ